VPPGDEQEAEDDPGRVPTSLPPACPDTGLRNLGHRSAITPLPWRIPRKLGNVSLRKREHRLLNLPSYAFPHSGCRTLLMRLEAGSKDGGGNRKGLIGREGRSRAKCVPTGMGPAHRCVPGRKVLRTGRAERIVNHRFGRIRDCSEGGLVNFQGGFYLGFLLGFGIPPRRRWSPMVTALVGQERPSCPFVIDCHSSGQSGDDSIEGLRGGFPNSGGCRVDRASRAA